ncbi:hypothetical protein [Microbacterium sp.]
MIAFLAVAEAGLPIGWAVAGLVSAATLTAGYFWASTRTDGNEHRE